MALKMMYWALQTPPFEFWPGLCLRDWGLDWNENLKLLKAHTLRTISTQGATKAFNLNQVLKATVKMPIYAMFFLWMSLSSLLHLGIICFDFPSCGSFRIPMIVYFFPSINLHSSHFVDTLFGYSLLSVQNRSQEKNQTKSIETINLYIKRIGPMACLQLTINIVAAAFSSHFTRFHLRLCLPPPTLEILAWKTSCNWSTEDPLKSSEHRVKDKTILERELKDFFETLVLPLLLQRAMLSLWTFPGFS